MLEIVLDGTLNVVTTSTQNVRTESPVNCLFPIVTVLCGKVALLSVKPESKVVFQCGSSLRFEC